MRARHTIIFAFLLLAIAGSAPAWAQGDPRVEARTHYMSGKSKFDAGDFRGAIAEFSAADNLAPSAVNDFNIALAYERLDDAAQAVRYYRSYLDRMPSAANRAEVEAALTRLDASAKAKADADRAEQARIAEEQRKADEARRLAEQQNGGGGAIGPNGGSGGAVGPVGGGAPKTTYQPTGDPELDRVAAVDLAVMRGASPLPAPTGGAGGGGAAAGGGAAGGAGAPPPNGGGGEPPVKKSKPFYKSPVFWVVAAVGLYVLIVLAQDDTSSQALMMPLPDGPANVPGGGGGATLFRF